MDRHDDEQAGRDGGSTDGASRDASSCDDSKRDRAHDDGAVRGRGSDATHGAPDAHEHIGSEVGAGIDAELRSALDTDLGGGLAAALEASLDARRDPLADDAVLAQLVEHPEHFGAVARLAERLAALGHVPVDAAPELAAEIATERSTEHSTGRSTGPVTEPVDGRVTERAVGVAARRSPARPNPPHDVAPAAAHRSRSVGSRVAAVAALVAAAVLLVRALRPKDAPDGPQPVPTGAGSVARDGLVADGAAPAASARARVDATTAAATATTKPTPTTTTSITTGAEREVPRITSLALTVETRVGGAHSTTVLVLGADGATRLARRTSDAAATAADPATSHVLSTLETLP